MIARSVPKGHGAGLYARLVSAAVHDKVAFPPPPKPRAGLGQARSL